MIMSKKSLTDFVKRVNVLPIFLMAVMCIGLLSCGSDDKKEDEPITPPSGPPTAVTITNNSVITLNRFRVVFLNSRYEALTDKDYGTLSPRDHISAKIPTGATQYYMATYLNNTWYFSAYYDITFTNMSLTDAEVGEWSANANTRSEYRDIE